MTLLGEFRVRVHFRNQMSFSSLGEHPCTKRDSILQRTKESSELCIGLLPVLILPLDEEPTVAECQAEKQSRLPIRPLRDTEWSPISDCYRHLQSTLFHPLR